MKMKKFLTLTLCAIAALVISGCSRQAELEESAVPVVNQIMEENLGELVRASGETLTKCTSVELTRQIDDKNWEGTAYFDNGREISCKVQDRGDQIYVEIDFASFK